MKKTIRSMFEDGTLHVVAILAMLAVAFYFAGCRAVTVENYGEEPVRDAEGKPVTLADGKAQTIKKGWKVHHNQHWMNTAADSINASIKPEEISFSMNGLRWGKWVQPSKRVSGRGKAASSPKMPSR